MVSWWYKIPAMRGSNTIKKGSGNINNSDRNPLILGICLQNRRDSADGG